MIILVSFDLVDLLSEVLPLILVFLCVRLCDVFGRVIRLIF